MIAYLECFRAKKFKIWAGLDTNRHNPDGIRVELETFDRLVLKLTREQARALSEELAVIVQAMPPDPSIPRTPWRDRQNYEPKEVRGPRLIDIEKGTVEYDE